MKSWIKDVSIIGLVILSIFLIAPVQDLWYRSFPKCNQFGPEFNQERRRLGILEIPEDWQTRDYASCSKTWLPPNDNSVRKRKIVVVEQGEIDSEMDLFVFGDSAITLIYTYELDSFTTAEISVGTKSRQIQTDSTFSIIQRWSKGAF